MAGWVENCSSRRRVRTSPSTATTARSRKSNSFCYIDLKKLLTTAPTADLLQMFIGEKAKAFRVLQSLSFTATNLNGKMSLKIDSKENSLKTLADLFAALR